MGKISSLFIFILFSCTSNDNLKVEYFDSGEIFSVVKNLSANKLCYEYYYKTGSLERTFCQVDSLYEGPIKYYYENGVLEQSGSYLNGELNGEYVKFYKNGQLLEVENLKNGQREGESNYYLEDGSLKCTYIFKDDIAFYKKCYTYSDSKQKMDSIETIAPIVELSNTELKTSEYLKVKVSLPKKQSLQYSDLDKYYFYFDDIEFNLDSLPFPRNKLSLLNGSLYFDYQIPDSGNFIFYGQLIYEDGKSKIEFNTFRENINVIE